MTCLSFHNTGICVARQFEVRLVEADGDAPEDFWFDREELMVNHADAVEAYEHAEGIL